MELIFTCILLIVAYVSGTVIEKNHYKKIKEREHHLIDIPAIPSKLETALPDQRDQQRIVSSKLVMGSCVISDDYFKTFIAGLKTLFGGHLTTYESLVDRARREASIRMKDEASRMGADMIVNARIETSSIGGGSAGSKNGICTIEVLAYGTALHFGNQPPESPQPQAQAQTQAPQTQTQSDPDTQRPSMFS